MPAFKDLSGSTFGHLAVLRRTPAGRHTKWRCVCDCGAEIDVFADNLTRGHTTSCGCARNEAARERLTVHGQTGSPEHRSWAAMLQRCRQPSHPSFERYGAVGVTVCERWMKFENFLADMSARPEGMTLDRIKSDRAYEPGNCRWATPTTQARNRLSFVVLSEELAVDIRRLGACGIGCAEIARRIDRHPDTVRDVLSGRTWKPQPGAVAP